MAGAGALGVIIPTFNEGPWVVRAVAALREAASSARWPVRIVVVDDGGAPEHHEVLTKLEGPDLRVLRQRNAGRFAARLAGLRADDTEFVLLLDSRVLVGAGSLAALREDLESGRARAWNFHVDVADEGGPWTSFWSGITKVFWRRYFARPHRVTFGTADFDRYPTGTTAFLAPRADLLAATESFDSLYDRPDLASDDTKLLRSLAGTTPITIDPRIACTYHGKSGLRRWAGQAYFRGTTFIDGYVPDAGRAAALLAGGVLLAAGATAGLVVRPRLTLGAGLLGWAGAGVIARASGGTPREVAAVVGLLPPFGVCFGAGLIRGLGLAVRGRR